MTPSEPDPKPGKLRIRAAVVCVHRAQLLCVRMRDPRTRVVRLFVPGGGIEAGETATFAAARETLEETGYRVQVDAESEVVAHYPYEWDGVLRPIITHFFRGSLLEPDLEPAPVNDADFNEGVVWLPLEEIPSALGFNDVVRSAVERLL
jgi:8-oxo-dGTP pyrophosphatase MutT (NUDIX family)